MKKYRMPDSMIVDDRTIRCDYTGATQWNDEIMFCYEVTKDGAPAYIVSVVARGGLMGGPLFMHTGTTLLQDRIDELSTLIEQHAQKKLESWTEAT